jgi:hypothetical protein
VKPTPAPGQTERLRVLSRRPLRVALWVVGIPLAILVVLYVTLLTTPIPLPFLRDQVRGAVLSALPPGSELELGDMALALEGGTWPVFKFAPVVFKDTKGGARIRMEALEVGFSPIRALVGQPGATVTMVGPHIQVNQDIFGPRLANFEFVEDPATGEATVRVLEGMDTFPSVGIGAGGIEVEGTLPEGSTAAVRSDNDWLIYNLEAAEKGMTDIVAQAALGRFSRLVIRDGQLDMNDALYGLFRQFTDITLDITPSPDGSVTSGTFSADFGGKVVSGMVERSVEQDGTAHFKTQMGNFDFASFMPFVDDREAIMAMVGAGAMSLDVTFDKETGKVSDGKFHVDLSGMDLRVEDDFFPMATSIIEVDWDPETAQFTMAESDFTIGQTTAKMSGVFVLGLDDLYGPIVGMSMKLRDASIYPSDFEPPVEPFTEMMFKGWSAPLYGATGIDQFVASKPGARIATTGRVDMLRDGMGLQMTIGGEGVTADDIKRLWPYFLAREARDWFVQNVGDGKIESATMRYDFPIGTMGEDGDGKPLPENSISIDMVATGVAVRPMPGVAPVTLEGNTRLIMRDEKLTVAADGAHYETEDGPVTFANAAFVMSSDTPGEQLFEISGDVSGNVPALVALMREQQPEAMDPKNLPVDIKALTGDVSLSLIATIALGKEGEFKDLDYAVNGTVTAFGSTAPIEAHSISGGQLSFTASQEGYRLAGQASVDGLDANVVVEGAGEKAPNILISSTLDVADLKTMGLDVSEFLSGTVKFVARPMEDGSLQMAVDIADAELNIRDLGVRKAKGVEGVLEAAVRQEDTVTKLSQVSLEFGDVSLKGSLEWDAEKGLQAADFTTFQLSEGDEAQLSLAPIDGGYLLEVAGPQLDLKPMLQRFFSLGEGSTGGPQATIFNQTIVVRAQLERALGFYRTTAFNLNVDMSVRGTTMQRVNLQASLGGDRAISVTTNSTPEGPIMSVAFNDLGTVLRLVGVYANLEGGTGTLVMKTMREAGTDNGTLSIREFALVDEENVNEILGNHTESRALIASQNKIEFRSAQVDFIRSKDRVEVIEGLVTGNEVGGTMNGFIYTQARTYDLVGTYVPLFGLSSAMQKIPLFGPLLAGAEGEGLFGVTFAIRGPLDQPAFQINPVSLLAPGAFRRIFEYRAKELPPAE